MNSSEILLRRSRKPLRALSLLLCSLLQLGFLGCKWTEPDAANWPPELPAKLETIKAEENKLEGWDAMFPSLSKLSWHESGRCQLPTGDKIASCECAREYPSGPLLRSGTVVLPYNLFCITRPMEGVTRNQYEVLYFDNERTIVRVLPEKNDKVLFLAQNLLDHDYRGTFAAVGATVRCGEKVFQIRSKGWYSDNVLLHPFTMTNPPSDVTAERSLQMWKPFVTPH